jgi:hypothetical protein
MPLHTDLLKSLYHNQTKDPPDEVPLFVQNKKLQGPINNQN